MTTLATKPPAGEVEYPSCEAERTTPQTEWHRVLVNLLIAMLAHHYRAMERVYVGGDMFVYFRRGDPEGVIAPDVFVVRGVEKRERDTYLVWNEGVGPEFVIEVISDTTRRRDMGRKFDLYRETLKVSEYFVFDPDGEHLTPRLQGWRLRGEEYVVIEAVAGRLPSLVTGLHLEPAGRDLRFWDPATGAWVPTEAERLQAAEEALAAAADRIRALEAELARRGGA